MNPGVMVLIWAPLSKRDMHLSPLTYSGHVSIPYHQLKGLGFKKGVCIWCFMPGVSCPGAPLAQLPFLDGLRLPSLVPSPLSGLKASLL